MTLWCRIKQSQIKTLSNQFKRCFFQIHGPCSVNRSALHTRIWTSKNQSLVFHKSQFEFGNNVRFFAAPVQVKPKHEEKDTSGPRLNEKITAPVVRLVTDDGHVIVRRHEALERARRLELDLVEVQKDGKPPVCKLMDYHKEMYERHIKEKEQMKSKSLFAKRKGACKEVRIACKIEKKDLEMKADTVKRLMEQGYRVKCMAMRTEKRDSEDDDPKKKQELAALLSRFSALIDDVSVVESGPIVEKKQAYIVVRHIQFGPPKKAGKKIVVGSPTTNSSTQSPLQSEPNLDVEESGLECEDAIVLPDEDLEKNNFNADDDIDKVFEFKNDVIKTHGQENRYAPTRQMNVTGPDVRNSTRFKPQFQNPGRRQQFDLNTRSPARETEHVNDPQRQSGTAEVNNRYKKGPNSKPPISNYRGNGRPYSDN